MHPSITAQELKDKLAGKKVCVLDVRRAADFDKSPETIAGAVWYDPEKVAEWGGTLAKDEEVVVYCVRGGSVSQSVVAALQEDHPQVRFLEGGMVGWQDSDK